MEATIVQDLDFISFNLETAHSLSVAPGVHLKNPLTPDGSGLAEIKEQRHESKMLHLEIEDDVLQPETACSVWNPQEQAFFTSDKITCTYFEVQNEMCPDQFLASCMNNLSRRRASVEGVMLDNPDLSPIMAAIIVGLNARIASSTNKISWFSDPNFGTGSYHSAANVDYYHNRSENNKTRLINMMNKIEGIDTILRRRAGEGRVAFVNTNDGTVGGNMAKATNIKDFLRDMLLLSDPVLRYWHSIMGSYPVYKLQSGLFRAYIDYLESLTGGADQHRFIVNGTPVEGVYDFEGYPVMEWRQADLFDFSLGLQNPLTGHSLNQRAILTVPGNPTLQTNVRVNDIGTGLSIQKSPLIKDKGLTWMYMNLGVGAGIAHSKLVTYGYNTSTTYQ